MNKKNKFFLFVTIIYVLLLLISSFFMSHLLPFFRSMTLLIVMLFICFKLLIAHHRYSLSTIILSVVFFSVLTLSSVFEIQRISKLLNYSVTELKQQAQYSANGIIEKEHIQLGKGRSSSSSTHIYLRQDDNNKISLSCTLYYSYHACKKLDTFEQKKVLVHYVNYAQYHLITDFSVEDSQTRIDLIPYYQKQIILAWLIIIFIVIIPLIFLILLLIKNQRLPQKTTT